MFAASSLLFVPGNRSDRFGKARAAGAGLTIIDLEDAVPAAEKTDARNAALGEFAQDSAGLALRINPVPTRAGVADINALADSDIMPPVLFVPMVEEAAELTVIAGALGDRCPELIPLIETPRGLRNALAICSVPQVSAIMFGGGDFSGELGVKLEWEPLLAARQQMLLAAAEAKIPSIDVPFIHLDDEDGLAEECARAKAIGFAAKAAIHPRQIAAIEAAFEPSDKEVAEAREALAAYEEAGGKVIRHKGKMLEAPLIKRFRAIIARKEGLNNA